MRMYDIILKKRDGQKLTREEIRFFISGYVNGGIPDYQASALLMAIYFNGMDKEEVGELTLAMVESGDQVDLSSIPGIKVDKHSTGGVGDKTTLIVSSIVASLGVKVAKMSGRGLGHTGGTVDKMESIQGLKTEISSEEFFKIVNEVGACVIGQTGNLVPADKKLYALRDVTGTIESIPLIASSVMSKKIAAGSDCILLDVKTGSGAFMKTTEDSIKLAQALVEIGEHAKRKTIALITDMNRPLGHAIGNALEIQEVVKTLKGDGPEDLLEVSLQLAANMLYLAGKGELEHCMELAKEGVSSGAAYQKLKEIVKAQGGDVKVIEDENAFTPAAVSYKLNSWEEGYLTQMDTQKCGIASVMLGAGRETKEDSIDPSAGIVFSHCMGDFVKKGEPIATLYASSKEKCEKAAEYLKTALHFGASKNPAMPYVYARITADGVEKFV